MRVHFDDTENISQRIQNLYRPTLGAGLAGGGAAQVTSAALEAGAVQVPPPDPPPKYTPPPSYSTATGARLLNTIRRSFRTLRRYGKIFYLFSPFRQLPH